MDAATQGIGTRPRVAPAQKWLRRRYGVLLSLSLMYFIAYIDRTNISIAAPLISKELG